MRSATNTAVDDVMASILANEYDASKVFIACQPTIAPKGRNKVTVEQAEQRLAKGFSILKDSATLSIDPRTKYGVQLLEETVSATKPITIGNLKNLPPTSILWAYYSQYTNSISLSLDKPEAIRKLPEIKARLLNDYETSTYHNDRDGFVDGKVVIPIIRPVRLTGGFGSETVAYFISLVQTTDGELDTIYETLDEPRPPTITMRDTLKACTDASTGLFNIPGTMVNADWNELVIYWLLRFSHSTIEVGKTAPAFPKAPADQFLQTSVGSIGSYTSSSSSSFRPDYELTPKLILAQIEADAAERLERRAGKVEGSPSEEHIITQLNSDQSKLVNIAIQSNTGFTDQSVEKPNSDNKGTMSDAVVAIGVGIGALLVTGAVAAIV